MAEQKQRYERLIPDILKRAFSRSHDNETLTRTEVQQEARAFADAPLDADFVMDESFFHVYEKPVYTDGQWQARFKVTCPSQRTHWDAPYSKLIKGFRNMADTGIKPSQTGLALADLDTKFDAEAAKIDYSHDL